MLKLGIEPLSYASNASTAYVVVLWPSFLFDFFVKIWATCEFFLGKWFTAPPGKKIPIRLCILGCKFLSKGCETGAICGYTEGVPFLAKIKR